jgi:hypothetical protein
MKRREFIVLIGVSAALSAVAQAQQQPTLGLLSQTTARYSASYQPTST